MQILTKLLLLLLMGLFSTCNSHNELDKWKKIGKLSQQDIQLLYSIQKEDFSYIKNHFDKEVSIYLRDSFDFNYETAQKSLDQKGLLYQVLFDVQELKKIHQVNQDMLSIKESIGKAEKIYTDSDFIEIKNKENTYLIHTSGNGIIRAIQFSAKDSDVISYPLTEEETQIIQYLKEAKHIELSEYFGSVITFGGVAQVNDIPYFNLDIDKNRFIKKEGDFYKVLFSPNIEPSSFQEAYLNAKHINVMYEEKDGIREKEIWVTYKELPFYIYIRYYKNGKKPRIERFIIQ